MHIPGDEKGLINTAREMINVCNVSQGNRLTAYQTFARYIETGQDSDQYAQANMLHAHEDKLSSHLFCPTDARFTIEFEDTHKDVILRQAEQVARTITRAFGRYNFDTTFGSAVQQSLDYGASILKLVGKTEMIRVGEKEISHIKNANLRIIPPWMFGVENEGRNGLDDQEAFTETVYLSEWDVKRRIANMPDKEKLWARIKGHSSKTERTVMPSSFSQLISAAALNIAQNAPQGPGGIVQTNGGAGSATMGPQVLTDQYEMSELWLKDDKRADYLMVQMIAPDILISPRYKRINEFASGLHPFNLVQLNGTPGYFWGRSEIVDMMQLQGSLSVTMDDFKRIMGIQYDQRLSFEGFDGDLQEMYEDFRSGGWVGGRAGSKVTDLTPKPPPAAIEYIKLISTFMDKVSGFDNILSGQGESGVRAGNHANTLMKTASPRLRDRSLIAERQYAALGDKYLSYMEAKDARTYYYDPENPEQTSFLLDQIPDDRQVMVDSHSSSPIYENDHNQLVVFGLKSGLIDGEDAIEMLNYPNKDELKRKFKAKAAAQAKLVQEHPELLTKAKPGAKK